MNGILQDKKKMIVAIGVLAVVLLILPFLAGMLGQAWVRILNVTLLYVMLALGEDDVDFTGREGSMPTFSTEYHVSGKANCVAGALTN